MVLDPIVRLIFRVYVSFDRAKCERLNGSVMDNL